MSPTYEPNKREQVNLRLSGTVRKFLHDFAQRSGVSQADVLELLLKEVKKSGATDITEFLKQRP